MLAGGGTSHASGGVGTLISYLLSNWSATESAPEIRVVDTRGAGSLLSGALRFAAASAVVLFSCCSRRPLIVHAHMTTRGSALRKSMLCALAQFLGAKIVVHQHGADFDAFFQTLPGLVRALLGAILRRSHAVIVLGDSARRFFAAEVGIAPERLLRIPNGVPRIPSSRVQVRDAAEPLLLFLGRLGDRKGVPELLAALGTAELRSRPWRAVLAGDGEVDRFRASVDQLGMAGRVEVRGWQSRQETSELLERASILVLPSRHEALPVAILEALSFGVAVIATPVGSIPDFLRDGIDALLTPPGDPEQLARAVIALLDDPGKRAELAANGHRTFLAELQIEAVANRLSDLYGTLASGAGMSAQPC
jgi:glycosyltransferase involved in cell wall biosynthesis